MTTPVGVLARKGATMFFLGAVPALFVYFAAHTATDHGPATSDFGAFWEAGRAVLHGRSPYLHPADLTSFHAASFAPFVYPAPAAVAMVPFALLPFTAAAYAWFAVSAAALVLALRLLGVRDLRCTGAVFLALPTASALTLGTFDPLLQLGLAVAWRFRQRALVAGTAVAAVVVAKLFLWPLLLWLLVSGRRRAAGVAVAAAVAGTAAAWAAIGFAGLHEYPALLSRLSQLVGSNSFSVEALTGGVLPHAGAVIAVVILVAAARARSERVMFTAAVAASLAMTPILWPHYLVLLYAPLALAVPRLAFVWLLPVALWLDSHPWAYGKAERIAPLLAVAAAVVAWPYAASAARTSSAWVAGLTSWSTRFRVPSSSMTKVERLTPM